MRYCIIDTESGGRQTNCTLLTAYFLIVNENFEKIDELYLHVKPDGDNHYIVNGQGMAINKIDIVEHDKIAVPYKQAKPFVFEFLKKNANGERLIPVGHAVKGDISRICENLISEGSWDQFCTYHFIDTSVVLQFLRACSKMPSDCDGSVTALLKYFNLDIEGQMHDAKVDATATALILKKFIELGK